MGRIDVAASLFIVCGIARADAPDLDLVVHAAPGCEHERAHCFAIHLHIAADANGLVAPPTWIAAQLATATREEPPRPRDQRRFSDEEFAAMRPVIARLVLTEIRR